MKRILVAALVTLGIAVTATQATAKPFLTTDPQEATGFMLSIDGGPWIRADFVMQPPLIYSRHDLAGTPAATVGTHRIEIKAVDDLWGQESDPTPFDYVVKKPDAPSGVGLSAE